MSVEFRRRRIILILFTFGLGLVLSAVLVASFGKARANAIDPSSEPVTHRSTFSPPILSTAAGATFVVNTNADTPDADVGTVACADASGRCTLRAAIMQANFTSGPNTITLPAGVYLLTRPGIDDASVLGDLDILDSLTIQGAGSGVTIVDGNGAVTKDRVFQILSSAVETSLSGLTIRHGQWLTGTFAEGGGLFWEGGGGHLRLNDVTVEDNSSRYGGGLYLDYSAGGGAIEIVNSAIQKNIATTGAVGGIGVNFSQAFTGFDLRSSRIYSNTAYEGGGLYFQGTLPPFNFYSARIETTEIYSNSASLSAGLENHSGNSAIPIMMVNSRLHNNHAGFYGGGIGNYGTLVISNTTLELNSAVMRGGGLYDYEGGLVDIAQSTFSGNTSQKGGGIYSELFIHNNAGITITNNTLSGNSASRNGGGIIADGGHIGLFNTTIDNNLVLVPAGVSYAGLGGGIYISPTAVLSSKDSIIANNNHRNGAALPEPDDCFGTLNSFGNNLIRTIIPNCSINPVSGIDLGGLDPLLTPLQFNGGPTKTLLPLKGSPVIDAGQGPTCTDGAGSLLTTDQRGFVRPYGAACDIGAVEFSPPKETHLPLVRK